jgi:hypothetical protein
VAISSAGFIGAFPISAIQGDPSTRHNIFRCGRHLQPALVDAAKTITSLVNGEQIDRPAAFKEKFSRRPAQARSSIPKRVFFIKLY